LLLSADPVTALPLLLLRTSAVAFPKKPPKRKFIGPTEIRSMAGLEKFNYCQQVVHHTKGLYYVVSFSKNVEREAMDTEEKEVRVWVSTGDSSIDGSTMSIRFLILDTHTTYAPVRRSVCQWQTLGYNR
jgi:hypothetical protein